LLLGIDLYSDYEDRLCCDVQMNSRTEDKTTTVGIVLWNKTIDFASVRQCFVKSYVQTTLQGYVLN